MNWVAVALMVNFLGAEGAPIFLESLFLPIYMRSSIYQEGRVQKHYIRKVSPKMMLPQGLPL
jgi:hypothetical protein